MAESKTVANSRHGQRAYRTLAAIQYAARVSLGIVIRHPLCFLKSGRIRTISTQDALSFDGNCVRQVSFVPGDRQPRRIFVPCPSKPNGFVHLLARRPSLHRAANRRPMTQVTMPSLPPAPEPPVAKSLPSQSGFDQSSVESSFSEKKCAAVETAAPKALGRQPPKRRRP